MKSLSPRLYGDLIGKPFEAEARGPAAYDCVGLAAEVQRRLGLLLPAFLSNEQELHRQLAAGGVLDDCRRIPEPVPGCVALVRMVGNDRHIGVMVDPYRILHTSSQTKGAVVERILDPSWHRRILGFYTMEAR